MTVLAKINTFIFHLNVEHHKRLDIFMQRSNTMHIEIEINERGKQVRASAITTYGAFWDKLLASVIFFFFIAGNYRGLLTKIYNLMMLN